MHSYKNIYFKAGFRCPAGWNLHSGECYKKIDEQATWSDARTKCRQGQPLADLVDIQNIHEESFIIGTYQYLILFSL